MDKWEFFTLQPTGAEGRHSGLDLATLYPILEHSRAGNSLGMREWLPWILPEQGIPWEWLLWILPELGTREWPFWEFRNGSLDPSWIWELLGNVGMAPRECRNGPFGNVSSGSFLNSGIPQECGNGSPGSFLNSEIPRECGHSPP